MSSPDDPSAGPPERIEDGAPAATLPAADTLPQRNWLRRMVVGWSWFQLVIGTLLKLTIRDRIPYLATIFYASPAIVLVGLAAILALDAQCRRQTRLALGLWLCVPLYGGWWLWGAQVDAQPVRPATADDLVVVCWNIRYVRAGWPALIAELKRHDADLIGLGTA